MFTILEFHNIATHGIAWTKVPPRRFAHILDILIEETHVIDPTQIDRYLARPSPDGKPHVMISFDDGYKEIYTNAYPLMAERGIAGMVSIVAGYVERKNLWDIAGGKEHHLDWSQIDKLLSSGWSICSHTMTHPDLKRCSEDRLEWELTRSKALLEGRLGMQIPAIAYPFGRFNARVLAAARQAGYLIGFTVGAETWRGVRGPLTTRRIPVYQVDSDALIRAKVMPDGFRKRFDAWKNRMFNKMSMVTSFVHRHRFKGIPLGFKL